jgi:hypothetical protein
MERKKRQALRERGMGGGIQVVQETRKRDRDKAEAGAPVEKRVRWADAEGEGLESGGAGGAVSGAGRKGSCKEMAAREHRHERGAMAQRHAWRISKLKKLAIPWRQPPALLKGRRDPVRTEARDAEDTRVARAAEGPGGGEAVERLQTHPYTGPQEVGVICLGDKAQEDSRLPAELMQGMSLGALSELLQGVTGVTGHATSLGPSPLVGPRL